jgi:hypothetical protein
MRSGTSRGWFLCLYHSGTLVSGMTLRENWVRLSVQEGTWFLTRIERIG